MSFFGRQLTIVASALQIFLLTDSSLQVGLLSLAQLGPVIVCSFVGGSLADAVDRRKLLIVANVLMATTSIGLAVNAMLGQPQVWPMYVCTALSAGFVVDRRADADARRSRRSSAAIRSRPRPR